MPPAAAMIALTAAAATAVATQLFALRRTHSRLRLAWREFRALGAMRSISGAALHHPLGQDVLDELVPSLGALTGTVTAVWLVAPQGRRSRLRVSSPSQLQDASTRAAAALLAASSLAGDEVPEVRRTLRSQQPQRGADLGDLLRAGGSALPSVTRDRLQDKLKATPYLAIPVIRGGRVLALLLAIIPNGSVDALTVLLSRAATRIALVLPAPGEAGRLRRPAQTASRRRVAPRDAEIVLWLDPQGGVVACEPLQDDWLLDPPPESLQQISGDAGEARRAMDNARKLGETSPETVTLPDGTLTSLSLVALCDVDSNLWGYAALMRRAVDSDVSLVSHPTRAVR